MAPFFLGGDLGGTKTRVVIADLAGQVLGFGDAGPGNHEVVGFAGLESNLKQAINKALAAAGLSIDQIDGAGFGIGGYDWAIEYEPHLKIIRSLGLRGALEIVNDTELGLLAGSPRGWGVAVVSGTGCNCRGWDVTRTLRGRVTGGGLDNGEFAGASELMFMTTRALAYEWTGRGPKTKLSTAFIAKYGVKDLEQLIQDNICHIINIEADDAPLVFRVAEQGDLVALDLVRWAGRELGELAVVVIRQLGFQGLDFDLVQIGSMFEGSALLTEEMKKKVHAFAPGANFIRLREPPVLGAVLLGMETAGVRPEAQVRSNLMQSISRVH
jgi:N-acetylglucosamine kinase-like BadF-type ATPase